MKKINQEINEFMSLKSYALIGASAKRKKFGNEILKQMVSRGLTVYPIHREALLINGVPCYPNLQNLPEKPEGVILVVHPDQTELIIKEIAASGIKYVWMQQGAESKAAIEFCMNHGVKVISNECILMFLARPGFPHNFHHWVWGWGTGHRN